MAPRPSTPPMSHSRVNQGQGRLLSEHGSEQGCRPKEREGGWTDGETAPWEGPPVEACVSGACGNIKWVGNPQPGCSACVSFSWRVQTYGCGRTTTFGPPPLSLAMGVGHRVEEGAAPLACSNSGSQVDGTPNTAAGTSTCWIPPTTLHV